MVVEEIKGMDLGFKKKIDLNERFFMVTEYVTEG